MAERHEEEAEGETKRLHCADHRGFLNITATTRARSGRNDQRGADAEGEEPIRRTDSDQYRPGRTRETDERKRVTSKCLTSQHHEPADDRGCYRNDCPRPIRVHHERVVEQLCHVPIDVPRQMRVHPAHQVTWYVAVRRLRLADDYEMTLGRAEHLGRRTVQAGWRLLPR